MLRASDIATLRELRIEALAESPAAFGSTLERELARTDDDWRRWIAAGAVCVGEEDREVCGLVATRRSDDDPATTELLSMWVAPGRRGEGLGAGLVAWVVDWAHAHGARRVSLCVFADNAPARALYRRCGFVEPGGGPPTPAEADVQVTMTLEVATSRHDPGTAVR